MNGKFTIDHMPAVYVVTRTGFERGLVAVHSAIQRDAPRGARPAVWVGRLLRDGSVVTPIARAQAHRHPATNSLFTFG